MERRKKHFFYRDRKRGRDGNKGECRQADVVSIKAAEESALGRKSVIGDISVQ